MYHRHYQVVWSDKKVKRYCSLAFLSFSFRHRLNEALISGCRFYRFIQCLKHKWGGGRKVGKELFFWWSHSVDWRRIPRDFLRGKLFCRAREQPMHSLSFCRTNCGWGCGGRPGTSSVVVLLLLPMRHPVWNMLNEDTSPLPFPGSCTRISVIFQPHLLIVTKDPNCWRSLWAPHI